MKRWEYWSIDCADDYEYIIISGDSNTPHNVYVDFKPGVTEGEYIITYNDGIRCVDMPYWVQQAGCPRITQQSSTIPSGDGSTGYPVAIWTPSEEYPLTSFTESHTGDGITNVDLISTAFGPDTVNMVILKCSANPSSTPRPFKIELTTSANPDCSWEFNLTQNGADCNIEWLNTGTTCITCTCGCDKLVLEETSVEIPMEGCDIPIGSFSTCIAEANILTAASETWAEHCINTVNNIIYLSIGENTTSERSSDITFNYTVCDGASCSKQLSIHQAGNSCGCESITYEGTEEADPTPPTPSEASITLSIYNGYSSPKQLGAFEIFTTEGSVQVGVDYQISAGETKNVTVDYTGFEGNTIYQVSGIVDGLSQCFSFTCPGGQCDLIDGDTLTVDIKNVINCT